MQAQVFKRVKSENYLIYNLLGYVLNFISFEGALCNLSSTNLSIFAWMFCTPSSPIYKITLLFIFILELMYVDYNIV
jgi:hypothetical protein